MKQRLGLAAAITEKPELILLDEPTNALDERGVEEICALIRRERDRGVLVIVACHDTDILEDLTARSTPCRRAGWREERHEQA